MAVHYLEHMATLRIFNILQKSVHYPLDFHANLQNLPLPNVMKSQLIDQGPTFSITSLECDIRIRLNKEVKDICNWYDYSNLTQRVQIPTTRIFETSYPDCYAGYYLKISDQWTKMSFLIPSEEGIDQDSIFITAKDYLPSRKIIFDFLTDYSFNLEYTDIISKAKIKVCCLVESLDSSKNTNEIEYYKVTFDCHDTDSINVNNFQSIAEFAMSTTHQSNKTYPDIYDFD